MSSGFNLRQLDTSDYHSRLDRNCRIDRPLEWGARWLFLAEFSEFRTFRTDFWTIAAPDISALGANSRIDARHYK